MTEQKEKAMKLWTIKELRDKNLLPFSISTLRRLIKDGKVTTRKPRGLIYIPDDEVKRLIQGL